MDKAKIKFKGKIIKCKEWDYQEFIEKYPQQDWQRVWKEEEFLKSFGINKPRGFVTVAASGAGIDFSTDAGDKEVYGVDFFRDKEGKIDTMAVYHMPFYKIGEKIVMPNKPLKIKDEHYVNSIKEFEEKHDESKNYKRK